MLALKVLEVPVPNPLFQVTVPVQFVDDKVTVSPMHAAVVFILMEGGETDVFTLTVTVALFPTHPF
jgi:hypothetical protein